MLLTFHIFVTTAKADPAIEGVWSFNGGRIAIQEQQPGLFEGTVVAPTKFALCTHPEGERIWTHIVQQSDGTYWGEHQWFFESSECVPNPAPGPTAWRILQNAGGRYLRVCFSEPGSNLQPTIAPSGAYADATFGCVDSALLSVLPEALSPNLVHLLSNKSCLLRHKLRVRVKNPKNDPIQRIVVTAAGGGVKVKAKIQETENGMIAVLPLERLAGERITVRVKLTTLLGHRLTIRRIYHRCRNGSRR